MHSLRIKIQSHDVHCTLKCAGEIPPELARAEAAASSDQLHDGIFGLWNQGQRSSVLHSNTSIASTAEASFQHCMHMLEAMMHVYR